LLEKLPEEELKELEKPEEPQEGAAYEQVGSEQNEDEDDWDWGWSDEDSGEPTSCSGSVSVDSESIPQVEESSNSDPSMHEQEEEEEEEEEDEWAREENIERISSLLDAQISKLGVQPTPEPAAPSPEPEAPTAAEATNGSVLATPAKRYHGVIKYFRGSFGWISSVEVAAMYPGMDVFLHKKHCCGVPKQSEIVSFHLAEDEKGNPKAEDARIEAEDKPPSPKKLTAICARDFFRERDARKSA
jgi:hypothetical protein